MINYVFLLEIIGTIAFAFSGSNLGLKRELDLLGVIILGVVEAVGGGVIRDLILGQTPPKMFLNPVYVIIASLVSLTVFIWAYCRHGHMKGNSVQAIERVMSYADTVGLAIFTVVGVRAAFDAMQLENIFLSSFVGVITGVGGGVLRDMMVGMKPKIFVKHIYALSSIIGAVLCVSVWNVLGQEGATFLGALVIILIRMMAIRFRWNLPRVELDEESKKV